MQRREVRGVDWKQVGPRHVDGVNALQRTLQRQMRFKDKTGQTCEVVEFITKYSFVRKTFGRLINEH